MLKPQPMRRLFVLEVVLREPQSVPSAFVHDAGDRFGLVEDCGEVGVGVAALVGRRCVLAAIGQIDVAGIDGGEFADHD
jgi:hypothetical protein